MLTEKEQNYRHRNACLGLSTAQLRKVLKSDPPYSRKWCCHAYAELLRRRRAVR